MLFKNLDEKSSDKILNGANLITLAGLWIIALVIVLRFYGQADALTTILTFLAIATDFFDGQYARMFNCTTEFGATLDKVRDKLFSGFYFWFVLISYKESEQFLYLFFGTLLCLSAAELTLLLAGIWGIARKKSVKSNLWGKRKMFFECVGMIVWVIFNDISPFGIYHTNIIPAIFILSCFVISFFLAGMSLKGYWELYILPDTPTK
jgi:phosphatidylglycerophosphate synthase